MPLVNYRAPIANLPGAIPEQSSAPEHSALDVATAAFRQGNLVTSLYDRIATPTLPEKREENYDALDDIAGFEPYANRFIGSESHAETANIKARIREELNAQQTLHEAGAWGHVASFAAGVVDPATLASMALFPEGGLAKLIAGQVAIDAGSELIQHQLKETRTAQESAINIGAGALLTGVLGGVSKAVPKGTLNKLRDRMTQELHGTPKPQETGGSVGAAAVGANTTLEQESIAGVGEGIAKTVGRISPLARVLTAVSKLARQVAQDLAEVPFALKKNAEGIASPVAVETLARGRKDAATYEVVKSQQEAYQAYRARLKQAGETPISYAEFDGEVAMAMRRKDNSPIQEVATLAARHRASMIEPTTKELQSVGLLRDPVKDAQAKLDADTAHEFVGAETQRITKDFIKRGGDESELATIRSLNAIEEGVQTKWRRIPKELKGLDRVHAQQKISAAAQRDIDKIEPHLTTRLVNRARAVLEGRATDSDSGVNALAEVLRKQDRNEIVGKIVPQKKTDVKGFDVIGADSYFPRLYDHAKIKASLTQFTKDIANWYIENGVDRIEAATIAHTVQDTILGTTRGFVHLDDLATVIKAGPLQGRTLVVPDKVLEPYLINSGEVVLSRYAHSVLPQLEMARKFGGSLDLKPYIDQIAQEYAVLAEKAATDKERRALEAELRSVTTDIAEMRDRILGKAGIPADPDSMVVRGARLMRDYNYVRLLGSQVFSSIADAGRLVTMYGLQKTGKVMATFATDLHQWKLARDEAKRLGVGLDWALNTRGASFADIGDFATTRLEDYSRRVTGNFNKITGMATWNSTMKFLAASLQQDEILKLAKSASISPRKREVLATFGIDGQMLERIAKQFDAHGLNEGLRRARSDRWDDREAARVFEASILKASDVAVLTKGVGDTPVFMSKEVWKTVFQFKSFGMAAVNRLLIPAAQGLQRGDLAYINGLTLMMSLGVMRYMAKQWTADQPIDLKPGTVVREAIDGSGMSSYLMDLYDPAAALLHLPRGSRYTDRNPIETMLGPTVGTATDMYDAASGISRDGVQKADIHRLRKLAPWQNVFYLRRAVNAMEDSVADAIDAK